ncbi:MAG TPA: MmgE/PrpD family protein [Beijerinckiaceae bacterium]|nr:MmgE/PrpD family protein [Beijerinckiaceae bacterium]
MSQPIARILAEEAIAWNYDSLGKDVAHQAKRHILDTLACAIGAYDADPCLACRDVAKELNPASQATLLGENAKVSISSAIIANETMIRYLDFNDVLYFPKSPGKIDGAHPSDALAAVFALGEWLGASGRDVIAATVAAYQVIGRIVDGLAEGLTPMGFHHGTVMPYGGAVIAGRLLNLNAEQITHAMGIGGSAAVGLAVNDAEGEEYNNTKNLADGLMVERGVLGAFLARRGFTGPERIIEGNKGFAHSLLRGVDNFHLKPSPNEPYIMQARTKFYPTESTNQGHLSATSELVRAYDLQPEDIDGIVVRTNKRAIEHNGDPAKKYPNNKETADHSAYFMTALSIVTRGKVTPFSFTEAAYEDPVIRMLTDKVVLQHLPEYDPIPPAAEVEIRTHSGKVLKRRVDHPKGNTNNRMSDEDLRQKFIDCANGRFDDAAIDRVVDICFSLEKQTSIGELMQSLAFAEPR